MLLSVQAERPVQAFDLRVRDLQRAENVLERVGEPIDPNRDVTRDALRLAIEFAREGRYRIHLLGRTGPGTEPLFALRDFVISGIQQAKMMLVPLKDVDGDGLPGCAAAADLDCEAMACEALDCNDEDRDVHPFSFEICGNGKDDDCSGGCAGGGGAEGDEPCEDKDGDGVGGPLDCDDTDPCRSPRLKEAENLCQEGRESFASLTKACLDHLASKGVQPPAAPYCGDGIDQDCNGQDVACLDDADCDGTYPPEDCDDDDPAVSPKASEECDGVDNNCNGVIDEGCVPCDVDGDGHAAPATAVPDCVDDAGKELPKDDPDDFDSGVFPGSSVDSGGAEGGTVQMALRGHCSASPGKNGIPARDVDHDVDGKPASDDGCPEPSCDGDGDGFVGPQCSPPASEADCDDGDPKIFPGAPDRCGDGVVQNCVADTACGDGDGDGDGYAGEADCDDGDADNHPWAAERCDGVDNDCDGLVDEGNPDADGQPMATGSQFRRCNDGNEGQCGGGGPASKAICDPLSDNNCSAEGRELSGTCACSRAVPTGTRSNDRVGCPGEDLAATASLRCFGAKQPQIERCDEHDWDCDGRQDDPTGTAPLVDSGKSCSTNVGNCAAGRVTGCDLGRSEPEAKLIEKVLTAEGREFNQHWVCEGAALPTAERCNGKDDDCDGELPADELDGDSDGYLSCSGCVAGADRLALGVSLSGCDDCNDGAIAVHPDALEVCNAVDDNCVDGLADDGDGDCAAGQTCCGTLGSCYDLSDNAYHCGACGNRCDIEGGETCLAGSCSCGDTGGPCAAGLDCIAGACRCVYGGSCSGCCEGDVCRSSTVDHCGVSGGGCDTCAQPADDCQTATCVSGSCGVRQASDGSSCSGGRCWDGTCCAGDKCWDGSKCVAGKNDESHCGVDGVRCDECWSDESCDWGTCVPK